MDQPLSDTKVPGAVIDILAAAVEEYCAAFAAIAAEVDRGQAATPEQLERAMAATLRLENAQTLLELDGVDARDAYLARPPHSIH